MPRKTTPPRKTTIPRRPRIKMYALVRQDGSTVMHAALTCQDAKARNARLEGIGYSFVLFNGGSDVPPGPRKGDQEFLKEQEIAGEGMEEFLQAEENACAAVAQGGTGK